MLLPLWETSHHVICRGSAIGYLQRCRRLIPGSSIGRMSAPIRFSPGSADISLALQATHGTRGDIGNAKRALPNARKRRAIKANFYLGLNDRNARTTIVLELLRITQRWLNKASETCHTG